MVMVNRATREITLKIVYYGPGLGGKTTNLEHIYQKAPPDRRGKLLSVSTETDRTLFFDFLPMDLGEIKGMRIRVQLYTVPGQVYYDATRRIVLRGCDGIVFVADSQQVMMDANTESVANLKKNLLLNTLDPETIPLVMQYNKQDLNHLAPVEELEDRLNWRSVPFFLSVATVGTGVHDALKKIIELTIRRLQDQERILKAPAEDLASPRRDRGKKVKAGSDEGAKPAKELSDSGERPEPEDVAELPEPEVEAADLEDSAEEELQPVEPPPLPPDLSGEVEEVPPSPGLEDRLAILMDALEEVEKRAEGTLREIQAIREEAASIVREYGSE
jgi:mutual gliding-motility protein MglA